MATTVVVPSVYPAGSSVSIAGQVTAGDGHVVGGVLGASFGTPTLKGGSPVGGVSTAQAFGTPLVLLTGGQAVHPAPVPSAAAFGVPTLYNIVPITGGVPSAQSFGALTIRAAITVAVPGVEPYPFYVPSITGQVTSGDGHVVGGYGGSGFQFGHPTIYTIYRQTVGGVPSAASFGAVNIVQVVHPMSVPSAQDFGTRIGIVFQMLGVPSAQAFGVPDVFIVWIRPEVCDDLDLALAACTDLDLAVPACIDLDLDVLVPT
jgi:hypothetical protein